MNLNRTRKVLIVILWIIGWQLASLLIHNTIIFVGPVDVLQAFSGMVFEKEFWNSILHSFLKISLGFLIAFVMGILLGSLSYRFKLLAELLEPPVLLMKSVPVASFVILALIWAGSKNLSILISGLVVFPVIYINTIAGLKSTDPKLLEMAFVFRIPLLRRIRFIYLEALIPYLKSGCKVALGMSWKSGIAAEVIGVPTHSIGEHLYMSKIYLDTAGLFAWTIVIIVVSAVFERLVLWGMERAIRGSRPVAESRGSRPVTGGRGSRPVTKK